ncbi:glycoside hydrolase superfamily, partial [Vararia minispora EC-137]
LLALPLLLPTARAQSAFPAVIPGVRSSVLNNGPAFALPSKLDIVVDAASAAVRDTDGTTLLAPSTLDFAYTFASDVNMLFPSTTARVSTGSRTPTHGIFVTVDTSLANATLASGAYTSEAYTLDVGARSVRITGSGARGAFWATRTFLQGLVLGNGLFPASVVHDGPSWSTRGFMLDVGRQWYPVGVLTELCSYLSWFKASEFHVHLSDNVSPVLAGGNPNTTYARFRLRPTDPALAGLTPHVNETYSTAEFVEFQRACAARGVTVVPELESPGHALVITQWKPELALSTDPTLINLTAPDAIPTIKAIWQEFLPIMHTTQVSIGADEYDSSLADDYNNFVNDMSAFMAQWNKTIRIWGTNEPSNKTSVSKAITIQHWEFFEDDPFALIRAGYDVINSDDAFTYVVMKFSGSYPQALNQTRLWDGANVATGGTWDPHIFDRGNASNNPAPSNPLLRGAIAPTWNDHGPAASTPLEAFYSLKHGAPAVLALAWAQSTLTQTAFDASIAPLGAAAPGQDLARRRVSHKERLVADWNFAKGGMDAGADGFGAHRAGKGFATPLSSFGPPYTLRLLRSNPSSSSSAAPQTLLAGPDDALELSLSTLAFRSGGFTYPLAIPESWREFVITATEGGTRLAVDGQDAGEFRIAIDETNTTVPMAFVAPLAEVGSAVGRLTLWDEV